MGGVPVATPIFPELLIESIAQRCSPRRRVVVAIDGADAADPVEFGVRTAEYVRSTGRSCDVVDLHDFVRPASLRFEYSKTDELSYRTIWFDFDALAREVIGPLREGGSGQFLPRLWDEVSDRSARARVQPAAPDHVILIAGPMLLGRGLDTDVDVHLHLSEAALRRRTPTDRSWTVPALLDFESSVTLSRMPDFWVRWDHPDRPAVTVS